MEKALQPPREARLDVNVVVGRRSAFPGVSREGRRSADIFVAKRLMRFVTCDRTGRFSLAG